MDCIKFIKFTDIVFLNLSYGVGIGSFKIPFLLWK